MPTDNIQLELEQLAIDLLSDMILTYITKQKEDEEVRQTILQIMEEEAAIEMEWELTAELLGTDQFRVVA